MRVLCVACVKVGVVITVAEIQVDPHLCLVYFAGAESLVVVMILILTVGVVCVALCCLCCAVMFLLRYVCAVLCCLCGDVSAVLALLCYAWE